MVKFRETKSNAKKDNPDTVETKVVKENIIDVLSDKFTLEERPEIVKIVKADVEHGERIQGDYVKQKELDLKHYHSAKPSDIENLTKKTWQSDRNLGLARAIADSFQATYMATCWTPETINFVATQAMEIDNRTNQEKFAKWGMGKQEANTEPEVDGFIHNKIVVGCSFFKIYKKVWEEWVDKRIPVKDKNGDTYKFDIKTEKIRREKGVIENIPDIDDILIPEYGKNVQELPYFVHILHLDGETVLDYLDRKVFVPTDKEGYKKKLFNHAYKEKERVLGEEKMKSMGVTPDSMTDIDVRRLTIDLYEWYGFYTKGARTERFRMIVDLVNDEFLSGKPVRKINRSGKIPFVGGSLLKEPGQIRGASYMQIAAPIFNAFNNVYNQKSDFQYVTNCPFGFFKPDEGYTNQKYELEPMVMYPVDDPSKVNIPNLSRSMAWAESDIRILFEVLERLTGAASYFQSRDNQSKTLGQDLLIDKNSETRFGLGVSRIQQDICEAISMWFELYQDYPPKGLAERIVGEDGKKLFPNLSVDSLQGRTVVQMTPDTVSGSKMYRKQLQLWAFQASQQTIWLSPQVNPQGNWQVTADTFKEVLNLSDNDVKRYLGEKPKSNFDESELSNEWSRFINGEDFDPPEGETALAIEHLKGHQKQKEEKLHLLDEEYRPNFDAHLFKTQVNAMKFLQNVQKEQLANKLAQAAIMQQGGGNGQMMPPNAPQPAVEAPGSIPGAPAQPMPGPGTMPEQGGMIEQPQAPI
jgi:hypothetical protein